MSDDFSNLARGLTSPGVYHATLTATVAEIDPKPLVIRCDAAGTATLVDAAGVSIAYNLAAGERIDWRPTKFTAGTATLIAWW